MISDTFLYDVFVSHATPDKDFARNIVYWLRDAGFNVWFDEEQLVPGASFRAGLEQGIRESRHLISILTKEYINRKWTERELELFDVLASHYNRRVLGLKIGDDVLGFFDQTFLVNQRITWCSDVNFDPEAFWLLHCGLKGIKPGAKLNWKYKGNALLDKKNKHADGIDEGVFTILVLGMLNNGKSTLLNAMFGTKILPARVTQTTGVITSIIYGNSDIVSVYEFDKSEPHRLTYEEFFEQYTFKADDIDEFRFKNVKYACMETKYRFCAHEVRLIDSPALSKQLSQSEIIKNFLTKPHAIIFILNASRLLNKEERDFILEYIGQNLLKNILSILKAKGALEEIGKEERDFISEYIDQNRLENVFFLINNINYIFEEEKTELYKRARKILSQYFYDSNGRFDEDLYSRRVFWVDALGALKARQSWPTDEAAYKNSSVKEFKNELDFFLTQNWKSL
jgi:GTPase SAR1 family protein